MKDGKVFVLIVEDKQDALTCLMICARMESCSAISATTLDGAEKVIQDHATELDGIFWDFELPDGTTRNLIKATVANNAFRGVMVVMGGIKESRAIQTDLGCTEVYEKESSGLGEFRAVLDRIKDSATRRMQEV